MILGEGARTASTAATLDDLFRRAGVRHPDAIALADPPNRAAFTDGAPRVLSFVQADRAISSFAARLRQLGLQTDTVVAIQLPNTVESIIAFLGVLRAGMIAAPAPLLWRRHDMAAALSQVGARAIVTCSRIGAAAPADIAGQTAAELFPIRHVCGFGQKLPDGIAPLDDVFDFAGADASIPYTRPGPAAAHVAAVTFGHGKKGILPVARSHVELVAGGLETFLETGAALDAPILSTIPIGSFAGIALTALPWLLSGGALHLHHGFDPDAFVAQCAALGDGTVMLPTAAIAPIGEAGLLTNAKQTVVALWRAPERLTAAKQWDHPPPLVDVASFGEIGVIASRRGESLLPTAIPHGVVDSLRRAAGAPSVIETARSEAGTLLLRGRMVPTQSFPPAPELRSRHSTGYVDTGFACRIDRQARALIVTAPPSGTTAVGGYRFHLDEIEELISQTDADATIVALPDADLGQRFAGSAPNRAELLAGLRTRGVNPLISEAFQPRGTSEAA
ncbi:MAG TPA: class I adenylate-forming enzyme family protein [Pseudolabrys sp.]|nr:class I adenylate-forming enzyme family protein [Pseudolabrys sp.]